ncbi:hypothetical protein FB451DRAFT_1549545 [Mycena latifolia]|nr:hypothetical protein FB451DRAFT_1549545 [Mycena latifolia]
MEVARGYHAAAAFPGVRAGAGVQFEVLESVEANKIMLCSGHGVLAPALGLGAGRALQFKGVYRTANVCYNEDLFFMLRGGGGGTFGVVLEAIVLAAPAAPVQIVTWVARHPACTKARALITDNMFVWVGWGGYAMLGLALFVTQRLDKDACVASMALITHTEKMKAEGVEGFLPFFTFMTDAGGNAGDVWDTAYPSPRGSSRALRLRILVVDALIAASGAPLMIIQITAPTAAGRTSVTPAWRDAVYHVTHMGMWGADMRALHRTTFLHPSKVQILRALNKADVYEPNVEVSF